MTEEKLNRLNNIRSKLIMEKRYLKALRELDKVSLTFHDFTIKMKIKETEDKIKTLTKEFEEG
jgi:uncharacterized protein (DUF111 family)